MMAQAFDLEVANHNKPQVVVDLGHDNDYIHLIFGMLWAENDVNDK